MMPNSGLTEQWRRMANHTTCACAYSYTISYVRPLSKITPSN